MARISISISDELREQLRARKEVNWSEVAREAFKQMLGRLEMEKATKIQDNVRKKAEETLKRRGIKWSATEEIRKWREARK